MVKGEKMEVGQREKEWSRREEKGGKWDEKVRNG